MKAFFFERYGSPDVLELREVKKPVPEAGQILVKIHAASVNPLDWHRMRAEPFLARLSEGFFKPKVLMLGADIAGVVEAIGTDVTEFQVGDEVFGSIASGGFAEYACAGTKHFVPKPANVSFEEAAGAPIVGLTALQGLRDTGKIQPGQKVLVNGASGGVGSFAVQIAKSYDTEVTGVCSTRNLEMVRSIGADHVLDYTKEDFTKSGKKYDLIYDAVGNHTVWALRNALTNDGIGSIAGFTSMSIMITNALFAGLATRGTNQKIGMMPTAQVKKEDMLTIKELLETDKVKIPIDRCYPLEETPEAIAYLETMRARGKVIIQMV